ncbi:MAG: type I-E CRISPR-associated protein Cas5/CasD [Dehalococcoidia bacterium]
MANSVLLLWLEGPIQSWGTRSRWDVRDTGLEPTKSGVIGLAGCAMGLSRDDPELEKLDRDIRFGVRIDRPGMVSTDFQTVTGYHQTASGEYKHDAGTAKSLAKAYEHGTSTIVSPRDYLHDSVFLVGLQMSLELRPSLLDAFASPHWPLYLGRKSCPPVRPLLDNTAEFDDLETAFRSHARHLRAREGKLTVYIEDTAGELERQDAMRINQLRMYDFRKCKYLEVDPPCISPS